MDIVERVRKSMNIATNAYDDELKDVVDAAKLEMIHAGVPEAVAADADDAVVARAIKCYVKADQAWEEPGIAGAQMESFRAIVNVLALVYGR